MGCVYFPFPGTSKVPLLAKLASASDVWNGEDPFAFLDEYEDGSAEERVDGDVETSVSCEFGFSVFNNQRNGGGKRTVLIGRSGSIKGCILVPHDKHGNLGPILALIPDLFRNEIVRRKTLDLGGPQQLPSLCFL